MPGHTGPAAGTGRGGTGQGGAGLRGACCPYRAGGPASLVLQILEGILFPWARQKGGFFGARAS